MRLAARWHLRMHSCKRARTWRRDTLMGCCLLDSRYVSWSVVVERHISFIFSYDSAWGLFRCSSCEYYVHWHWSPLVFRPPCRALATICTHVSLASQRRPHPPARASWYLPRARGGAPAHTRTRALQPEDHNINITSN